MANQKSLQKGIFDLDSFQEVTLAKKFEFAPVASVQDALARVDNDPARLLKVLNDGLVAEQRRQLASDPTGWHTMTDEGTINGEFTGTVADIKAVNALVLTLAKTVFGYSSDPKISNDARKAAKASAMKMISETPAIKEGLKKSAALKPESEDEDEDTNNAG